MTELTLTSQERYARLVEWFLSQPGTEISQEGKGFGASALKYNGKIFALLSGARLVVKLPRARVAELVAAGEGEAFDPRKDSRLMKEWLSLHPASRLEWQALAAEALEFVASRS